MHLTRIDTAFDVSADARKDRLTRSILVEAFHVKAEITA